jgi:putative PEP-CTERM system TPR-repeat lipoprotein
MTRFVLPRLTRPWAIAVALAACVACGGDRDARKRDFVASGDRFAREGKHREAAVEYRNAVQLDPMYGEARLKLAEAFERSNELTRALEEYVRASDLMPADLTLQLKTGNFLLAAKRADDALVRAEQAIKIDPQSVDAHVLRGNALGGLNKFDQALVEIEEALRLDPSRGATYTQVGLVQSARGRLDEAEAAFKRAVELAPASIDGWMALANFYWAGRRSADAANALHAALERAPNDAAANHAMAVFSLATGRIFEAERYLKQLVHVTKSDASHFALADYYVATRRSADAIALLTPLATAPNAAPDARRSLARAYAAGGQSQRAHALIDQLLAEKPADASSQLLKGQVLLAEDRRDEAIAAVKAAVSADRGSASAHFTLGRAYAARGDLQGAESAFREVLRINPSAAAAQTELSILHLGAQAPSAALVSAEAAVQSQPNRLEARLTWVRSLLAAKQFERARTELQQLLIMYPGVAAVHVQHAVLLASRNDVAAARATFEKALAIDRASLEALAGLLALSMNAKDYSGARSRVKRELESGPATPGLLLLAARTYGSSGDLRSAERALRQAIELDPSLLPAYSMLAEIYLRQEMLDAARTEFEKLAEQQSNPVGALTMVGLIFQAQGNTARARALYERVVAIDPRAAVASNNLAWLYVESGDRLDDALRLARNAAEVLPDAPEVLDTLGWTYYRAGLVDAAIAPLVRAVEKAPKNAEFLYHLGVVYAEAKEAERGRDILVQALSLDGSAHWADDARKKLDVLAPNRQ